MVDRPRHSFEREVNRYKAFAEKVAALTPDAWSRIQGRCADLTGDSFAALLRRARLAARAYDVSVSMTPRKQQSPTARVAIGAIAGISRAVQTGIAVAFELGAEFESQDASRETPRRPSGRTTTDTYVDAAFQIEAIVQEKALDPGVAAAIRSAAQAVLRHDWIATDAFDDVYQYVENEIPFDSLEPPQPLLTAGQVSE